jgi:hypothetical protein
MSVGVDMKRFVLDNLLLIGGLLVIIATTVYCSFHGIKLMPY